MIYTKLNNYISYLENMITIQTDEVIKFLVEFRNDLASKELGQTKNSGTNEIEKQTEIENSNSDLEIENINTENINDENKIHNMDIGTNEIEKQNLVDTKEIKSKKSKGRPKKDLSNENIDIENDLNNDEIKFTKELIEDGIETQNDLEITSDVEVENNLELK